MKKKRSPFVTYTTDDILASEEDTYVIQVGEDFFSTDTDITFGKNAADSYYEQVVMALKDQLKNGNKKDRKEARDLLQSVRIIPLRFH